MKDVNEASQKAVTQASTKQNVDHITVATSTHGGHYILSSLPTYDGIGADEYIAWELKIDNIFAQILYV
jgi:hypothetical protein